MGFMLDGSTLELVDHGQYKTAASKNEAIVHRCNVGETLQENVDSFINGDAGKYTGHKFPYHLYAVAPHAASHNARSIGIAVHGDFRYNKPSPAQVISLSRVCAFLSVVFDGSRNIHGHDEVDGASSDIYKRCPGRFLDMDAIRDIAAASAREYAMSGNMPHLDFVYR